MAALVLGMVTPAPVSVDDPGCLDTAFVARMNAAGAAIAVRA
jgi:citrate lyase gamma subunit